MIECCSVVCCVPVVRNAVNRCGILLVNVAIALATASTDMVRIYCCDVFVMLCTVGESWHYA
jgi:hypothetical protein